MKCPRCGYIQSDSTVECKSCGVFFAKLKTSPPKRPVREAPPKEKEESLFRSVIAPGVLSAALLVLIGVKFHGKFQPARLMKPYGNPALKEVCMDSLRERGIPESQFDVFCGDHSSPRPDAAPKQTKAAKDVPGLNPAALQAYEQARDEVMNQHFERSISYFQKAVIAQPDFTEAWYNMGASFAHIAIAKARAGSEQEEIEVFKQAVKAKKRARQLIAANVWYVYRTAAEQNQVKYDLENGLEDADDILADEEALKAGLEYWAEKGTPYEER